MDMGQTYLQLDMIKQVKVGRTEYNSWDMVSIAMSIIGIINAAVMAAAAAICKNADDGNPSTMTELNLYAMFLPIFMYHLITALLTLIASIATITMVVFSFNQKYQWGGEAGLWLAVLIFLLDLGVPFAILLGELSWNGVNNFPTLNIFEMYSRTNSQQEADLKILYGVQVVLGFSIFLLANLAAIYYWIIKLSQRKEEGKEDGLDGSRMKLGINPVIPQQKMEGQGFE